MKLAAAGTLIHAALFAALGYVLLASVPGKQKELEANALELSDAAIFLLDAATWVPEVPNWTPGPADIWLVIRDAALAS